MSACSQCGTVAKATDKFCNVCGTPLARQPSAAHPAAAAPPPQYAPTPPPAAVGAYAPTQAPPPGPYGASPAARCQMGHEIAAGASYCAQGHPIALDQMQFSNDAYGSGGQPQYAPPAAPPYAPQGAAPAAAPYGAPQHPAPVGYAAPPLQPVYGAPQQGYAPAAPPPPAYPSQSQAQAYAPPQPFGGAPAPAPYPLNPQAGYPQQPGYGAPPPAPAAFPQELPREPAPAKILRGFLIAYSGNPSGDFWPLTGGRLVIGRLGAAEGIDISIQDPTISSRHAAMVVDAGTATITVEDTGSTNGTFVNDEHIGFNGRRELRDGDRLRFGGCTTIVKVIGRV